MDENVPTVACAGLGASGRRPRRYSGRRPRLVGGAALALVRLAGPYLVVDRTYGLVVTAMVVGTSSIQVFPGLRGMTWPAASR